METVVDEEGKDELDSLFEEDRWKEGGIFMTREE